MVLTLHRLCPWSEKVPISVGVDQKTFYVDKFLLNLRSGLFGNKFSEIDELENKQKPLSLPTVDPAMFAEFVCWMSYGTFMPFEAEVTHSDTIHFSASAWLLGHFLEAPCFQNFVIWEEFRDYGQSPAFRRPSLQIVRSVYELTEKGSKLRRFAADSVAAKNPFKKYSEEDQEYDAWCKLFKEFPELGLDVAQAAGKNNDKYPWDDENIGEYMEEEVDPDQSWDELILKARTQEEIEEDAWNGCIRSKIELDHLNRE